MFYSTMLCLYMFFCYSTTIYFLSLLHLFITVYSIRQNIVVHKKSIIVETKCK